tara:strand:- start:131 stop:823 length:693 start_codon:yes stop_codon:yes gene_type:complete
MAPLLIIIGQQIFRVAGTAAVKKATKILGGRIVNRVPKEFAKKKIKDERALQKLLNEKEPTTAEKIGNLFVKKPKRVKPDSPGRTNVDEGISTGKIRLKGHDRGEQVKGAGKATAVIAGVAAPVALTYAALAKKNIKELEQQLKTETDEKNRLKLREAINEKVREAIEFDPKKDKKTKGMKQGGLTKPKENQTGLKKLPTAVRNKMGYMNRGGLTKTGNTDMRKGGMFYK